MRWILKKLSLLVMIPTFGIFAGGNAQPTQADISGKHKVFIYGAGGISLWNVETNPSSALSYSAGALDDSGSVLETGLGYRWNEKLFSTLSYQRIKLDAATINLSFLSLNYQFSDSNFRPYVGVIAGYGSLIWDKAPDEVGTDSDLTSRAMAYGLQTGVSVEVNSNLSVFAKYEIISNDYTIDIYTPDPKKTIEHKSLQNLVLGVKYAF